MLATYKQSCYSKYASLHWLAEFSFMLSLNIAT